MKTSYKTMLVIAILIIHQTVSAQIFPTTPITNPFGINTNVTNGVYQPTFADIDNDGDQDLLIGRSNSAGRKLEFYENTGTATNPNFANPIILIDASLSNPPYNNWTFIPTFGDVDGDGDLDLFIGRSDYNSFNNFEYYKNTGTVLAATFSNTPFTTSTISQGYAPLYFDGDGDGDLDLFIGEKPDYTNPNVEVEYYENDGTSTFLSNVSTVSNPSFIPISNVFGNGAANIAVGDLDLDGNIDMLIAENSNDLLYFKSDSNGNFSNNGVLMTNTEAFRFPVLIDIDNDGDLDLFIGMETKIVYFENTQNVASINNNEELINDELILYPNPVKDEIHFKVNNIKSYKIYDIIGKVVQEKEIFSSQYINVFGLKNGTYFIKLFTNDNLIYTSKFIIN